MPVLNLSEEQFKYVFTLLDHELRLNGINAMNQVVDFHNVLVKAAQPPAEVPEQSEKLKTDSGEPA